MNPKPKLVSRAVLVPFILVTSLFFAWGFANDITNPMVKAFSKIFRMSTTDGALVQLAFYGGYFAMAFPAALFIRKFSYKSGRPKSRGNLPWCWQRCAWRRGPF